MRLVFIGATGFGHRCLQHAIGIERLEVVGILTGTRSFAISYAPTGMTNVLYVDFESLAKRHHIPLLRLTSSMSDPSLRAAIENLKPDAFLVVGWYHMIPRRWREIAPSFGLHASLLPDYSGGAPLVWAMINGETKTGITLFRMGDGIDDGPIVAQAEEAIRPDDTIATLYRRIEDRGLELLAQALPELVDGTLHLRPQALARRRLMPQRTPDDGRIDWNRDASFIDRWIRAQTRPYPGAFTESPAGRLTIWSARRVPCWPRAAAPGHAFPSTGGGLGVVCGDGAIEVTDWSLASLPADQARLSDIMDLAGTRLGASKP